MISIIQDTETFNNPKIELEQYTIDAQCAVDIIYFAGFEFNDIADKLVFDLGAGSGRLSIASVFLNASYVISLDIDFNALKILKSNIQNLNLGHKIFPVCADITNLEILKLKLPQNLKITTIMNPPFGVKKRKADRIFLEKAFYFSDIVYSIHMAGEKNRRFISDYAVKFNWIVDYILPFKMILERSFPFHTQKSKNIDVDVYRFIKKDKK